MPLHFLPPTDCRLPMTTEGRLVNTPAAVAAARALLNRAVRDRANVYGGSNAVGLGWEVYLLPRIGVLAGRTLPDEARLVAVVPFGAVDAVALECAARGLRQPDFLFLVEASDSTRGIAGADAKLGLDTVDAKQIAAETTARILTEGGPLAQAAIAALAPADTPAADGYILTPRRTLNDLVLDGARPIGMPPPKLPARNHLVQIALTGAALLAAVATGSFARALVEGTDEAHEADTQIDPAILLVLAAHLLLGVWREHETPLIVGRIGVSVPTEDEYERALLWGRERVFRAGNAWEAATVAADKAKPRIAARARVQEALQPPMGNPAFLPPAYLRGKEGRTARARVATVYRDALLAALPPDTPDRSDALLAAFETIKRYDADRLQAAVAAALRTLGGDMEDE